MTRQIIYETSGRAREFSELACNLYDFCQHGCVYCYSPLALHKNRGAFHQGMYARINAYDVLKSAKQFVEKGETRRVLISFTCDPYQPIEQETMLTRKVIMALHEAGMNVTILTKAGLRSTRDFDLLTPKDAYASTLTCLYDKDSEKWEHGAAPPAERLEALKLAHNKGIETWVSLEPILYPEQTADLIKMSYEYVGHYKLSKLNYINQLPPEYQEIVKNITWYEVGWFLKSLMDFYGAKYYFKRDMLREMKTDGNFKQTWVCK